jgi:hypothetical protein
MQVSNWGSASALPAPSKASTVAIDLRVMCVTQKRSESKDSVNVR